MPVDDGSAAKAGVPALVFQPPVAEPVTEEVAEAVTEEVAEAVTEEVAEAVTEEVSEPLEIGRPIVALSHPRDGVPEVIQDAEAYARYLGRLAAGTGPVAIDAERASGHRYGQRAFLVQVRREGASTALIDPVALPDLSALSEAMSGVEWVVHAASQDLPCLLELGMHPAQLFDTELGGRLAGLPRVGLAAMTQELLGLSLAKEHSAVDWSTRPLPEPWLRYAALDVEVLVDLRDAVAARLEEQGKLAWAMEEFAAVAATGPAAARVDPWRRTSGMHRVRDRRRLAAVRELWTVRESIAQHRDISPGRVLPDSAIVEAAMAMPLNLAALMALPGFTGRGAGRHARAWQQAIQLARSLPDADLPPQHLPADGPPPPRMWGERDPAAAARLAAARATLAEVAVEYNLPMENLLSPDSVRRLTWQPPQPHDEPDVAAVLRDLGAREWQVTLTAARLAEALDAKPSPS